MGGGRDARAARSGGEGVRFRAKSPFLFCTKDLRRRTGAAGSLSAGWRFQDRPISLAAQYVPWDALSVLRGAV